MEVNGVNQSGNVPNNQNKVEKEDDKNKKSIFQYDNDKNGTIDKQEAIEYIKEKTGKQNIDNKHLESLNNFKIDLKKNLGMLQKTEIMSKINNIIKNIITEEKITAEKSNELLKSQEEQLKVLNDIDDKLAKDLEDSKEQLQEMQEQLENNTLEAQLHKETFDNIKQDIESKEKLQKEVKIFINLELQAQAENAGVDVDMIIKTVVDSYKGEKTDDESINVATKEILARSVEAEIVKALGTPKVEEKQIQKETFDNLKQDIESKEKLQKEVKMFINLELQAQAENTGIDVDMIVKTVVDSYKGEKTNDESINVATKEILARSVEAEIVKALENAQKTD